MTNFVKPDPLVLTGNLSENWKTFKEEFDIYLKAFDLEKVTEDRKITILLNVIGKEARQLYNTFILDPRNKGNLSTAIEAFQNYCNTKKNILYSRFLFYSRQQEEYEPFDEFYNNLKTLIIDCDFKDPEDLLRDRVILGCHDKEIKEKLMCKDTITLEDAINGIRAKEFEKKHSNFKFIQQPNYQIKCSKCGHCKSAFPSSDSDTNQELYNKLHDILNELTPQTFETSLAQVKALTIDTKERLQGVTDLIFEKAVDQPNFPVAYARMCRKLALMRVPAGGKKEDSVNFRKLLVTRCQMKFEKKSNDETARNIKVKEIKECTDPEKKKELQLLLEENDRRLRRKSVGNIRFIGELFKQQMLTVNVIVRCLNHLLKNKEEESLECLCELLSTVGKEVEEKKVDLNPIFIVIREIVDRKHGRISGRVRFMLQDVIDLRNCKWVPRRQDINPKTIDQIQKEANDEQLTIQPLIDEPLGSSQMFGTWMRRTNIKQQAQPTSANMYVALENIGNDIDKRGPMNYSSKDSYHSKGTSLKRSNYKHAFEDGRGSRSGSQHRSHDNSQRSKPMPTFQQNLPKSNPPTTPKQSDQLQRKIKNILEEYLNDCYTVSECEDDIRTSIPQSAFSQLVSESYIYILERSRTARLGSGTLFAHLIKRGTLSIDNYCVGVEEVLSQADDLTIDFPKIWDYLAEIIAPIVLENAVSLTRLHKSFDIMIRQNHASKLLGPLFKLVIAEKGPNYLHSLWQSSGLNLSDFMPSSQVNDFIEKNQLDFLLGGSNTVVSESELTYEQIHQKLLEFFAHDNLLDDIFVWIKANIGERANEKQFVRTLATAVFEDSIVKSKLRTENLRKHYSLLIRILDGRLEYELECLYALQALINKLEHPQGILSSICGALYDENIFSHASFVKWETSENPAEQEGKGVAFKQLASFFTQLKEADEETSSTEDA